jgi:hypothetical protein
MSTPRKSQRTKKPVTSWEEKRALPAALDPKITEKRGRNQSETALKPIVIRSLTESICKGCSILLPSGTQTARPKEQNSARQRTIEHNQLIYLAPNIITTICCYLTRKSPGTAGYPSQRGRTACGVKRMQGRGS